MHPAYRLTINGAILSRANLLLWLREFFRTSNITKGYVLEFGILNGESMAETWRCLRQPLEHIYGFDSFEGLPESPISKESVQAFAPLFTAGNYKSIGLLPVSQFLEGSGIPKNKFTLIPGFFDKSLPNFSTSHLTNVKSGQFPLMIHIDCDLYESAIPCFNFISPLVQTGTWLLLDDYLHFRGSPKFGVRRALDEWLKSNKKWGVSDYANYGGYGKAFIIHEL